MPQARKARKAGGARGKLTGKKLADARKRAAYARSFRRSKKHVSKASFSISCGSDSSSFEDESVKLQIPKDANVLNMTVSINKRGGRVDFKCTSDIVTTGRERSIKGGKANINVTGAGGVGGEAIFDVSPVSGYKECRVIFDLHRGSSISGEFIVEWEELSGK